jgi:RNA recognition motif-containing protein
MGYAFVEFEDEKNAKDALELDNTEIQGRKVRVQLSTNELPHQSRSFLARPQAHASASSNAEPTVYNDDLTIFVSNLPFSCNKDDVIKGLASVSDMIRDVRLAMDAKEGGRCRGFGYIEFADVESVAKALAISNPSVKGRAVNISSARDKRSKSSSRNNAPASAKEPEGEGEEKRSEVRYVEFFYLYAMYRVLTLCVSCYMHFVRVMCVFSVRRVKSVRGKEYERVEG